MLKIKTEQEVSTIILDNNDILYGTYHLNEDQKTGKIYKNNDFICETSGTFQILKIENSIFSANSKEILKIENVIFKLETQNINTSIYHDDFIYVAQSNGNILILNKNLTVVKIIHLCSDHIIWIVKKHEDFVLAGCDCGNFIIYNIKNEHKRVIKRKSGVTSIHKKNDYYYVSSYDGLLKVYNKDFEEVNSIKIGNVWRIIEVENYFGLACMYDGVKITDADFNIIKSYETKSIAYGIDYTRQKLVFSDFYEKYYFIDDDILK